MKKRTDKENNHQHNQQVEKTRKSWQDRGKGDMWKWKERHLHVTTRKEMAAAHEPRADSRERKLRQPADWAVKRVINLRAWD